MTFKLFWSVLESCLLLSQQSLTDPFLLVDLYRRGGNGHDGRLGDDQVVIQLQETNDREHLGTGTRKRGLFSTWEYALESGWTFMSGLCMSAYM